MFVYKFWTLVALLQEMERPNNEVPAIKIPERTQRLTGERHSGQEGGTESNWCEFCRLITSVISVNVPSYKLRRFMNQGVGSVETGEELCVS